MASLIEEDREKIKKLFEEMDISEVLKDMVKTHRERLKWNGSSAEYYWLTQRFKIALLKLIEWQII